MFGQRTQKKKERDPWVDNLRQRIVIYDIFTYYLKVYRSLFAFILENHRYILDSVQMIRTEYAEEEKKEIRENLRQNCIV